MNFAADILIWVLLATGIGFCALGLFGLVIFPDIRSRMYTAVRATIIGVSALMLSGMVYAVVLYSETSEGQYLSLAAGIILLYAIVLAGTLFVSREIENRVRVL